MLGRGEALGHHGNLDDDVRGDGGEAAPVFDDLVARHGHGLSGDGTVHDLADARDMALKIGELAPDFRVERRVGRNAGYNAPGRSLANLVEVGGVQEELHALLLCCDSCYLRSANLTGDLKPGRLRRRDPAAGRRFHGL